MDSETGAVVDREDWVKGYEVGKGDYVTDEELAAIEIESSHTIEIESFVPRSDVDPLYFDNRYFIAPDDKVGQEAFAVIRGAMHQRDVAGNRSSVGAPPPGPRPAKQGTHQKGKLMPASKVLEAYRRKRDFSKTIEPSGRTAHDRAKRALALRRAEARCSSTAL